IVHQVFDALLELDEKLVPAPALAERWSVSPDHRVYTFHLRRGAKFHNGREVRAADVKYSFERAARGKRPWVFDKLVGAREFIKGGASEIAGVRVVDEGTVELRLERPFAPFLHLMAYDAASIVPREETDKRGAGFASHPVGTGAFRFVSWRRDDQVVLERFAEHFRGPAHLERVVFRVIPAEGTRFNEYVAGQLDVGDIPTGRCRAVQADAKLKGDVAIWPTLGTSALRFNVERAPFTDARVRRAIAHAIDPSIIVDRLLEGCVKAAQGIVPPVLAGWIADYPDPENFLTVLFHSRNVGAAGNTSRYRNPAVDRLLDEADTMAIGAARMKRYEEAEQMILDDAVWVSLYFYASRALIKPYVKGLERSPQSTAPEFLAPLRKVWLER